jgi:hypothetical protein
VGSPRPGHARRLPVSRLGCARAVMGSTGPSGPQRSPRRDAVMGHAQDRGACRARGAVVAAALGAGSSATATAATTCRSRVDAAGCSRAARRPRAILVAAGRTSCTPDLPRAACGRSTDA